MSIGLTIRVIVSCRLSSTRATWSRPPARRRRASSGAGRWPTSSSARAPPSGPLGTRPGACRAAPQHGSASSAAALRCSACCQAQVEPVRRSPPALAQDPRGEHAGGLDVGRVVQQHERLLRDVRAGPLGRALLAAGRVEGQQARVQERALPPGVEAAAVLVLALVGLLLARREVQVLPVAGRLVRLDARPADLRRRAGR